MDVPIGIDQPLRAAPPALPTSERLPPAVGAAMDAMDLGDPQRDPPVPARQERLQVRFAGRLAFDLDAPNDILTVLEAPGTTRTKAVLRDLRIDERMRARVGAT